MLGVAGRSQPDPLRSVGSSRWQRPVSKVKRPFTPWAYLRSDQGQTSKILITTGFTVRTRKIIQWRVAIHTLRVAACNRSDFLLEIIANYWTSVLGLSATVLAFGRLGLHSTAGCSD